MKKLLVVVIIALLLIPVLSACSKAAETTPLSAGTLPDVSGTEQQDDVILDESGWVYRANIIVEGEQNPWPPIQYTKAIMDNDTGLYAKFRGSMETGSGEVRTNIILLGKDTGTVASTDDLELYTIDLPDGIVVKECENGAIAGQGSLGAIITIDVAGSVSPGDYTVYIGLKVNGEDYGRLPCKVTVTD